MDYTPAPNIETTLPGLTFTLVNEVDSDRIEMETQEGRSFALYHSQDCCESVRVDSIKGDLANLIGAPLLDVKEEIVSRSDHTLEDWPADEPKPEWTPESWTWTTFTFATVKGTVVIRWLGTSNGYYSESVSFIETTR